MNQNRRSFLVKSGLFTSLTATPFIAPAVHAQSPTKGDFIHMVFFWLKDTSDENIRKFIKDTRTFLDQIKEVNSYHVGPPANTTRPIVNKSYTVGLMVEFNSILEHDIYQEHPAHKRYVEENNEVWEKVQVFDTDRSLL